jgi:hypothetical protein
MGRGAARGSTQVPRRAVFTEQSGLQAAGNGADPERSTIGASQCPRVRRSASGGFSMSARHGTCSLRPRSLWTADSPTRPGHRRWAIRLVGRRGLEPPTSTMSTWRSNQLSYLPDVARILPIRASAVQSVHGRGWSPSDQFWRNLCAKINSGTGSCQNSATRPLASGC